LFADDTNFFIKRDNLDKHVLVMEQGLNIGLRKLALRLKQVYKHEKQKYKQ